MRVIKDAAERKQEILDVAERLFSTKGYDDTSTNDILKEIGIARGTLYYHFQSKEEILDAMIERMGNQLIAKAREVAQNKEVPVLQRVIMTIMSMHVDDELTQEVLQQVHKPQNALMHQKMQESMIKGICPILAGIVKEGIEQGVCNTEYPDEAVEMMMIYANTAFYDEMNYSPDERERKISGFVYHIERIFGLEEGCMMKLMLPLFQTPE